MRLGKHISLLFFVFVGSAAGEEILWCQGKASSSPLCVEFKVAMLARGQAQSIKADLEAVTNPPWIGNQRYETRMIDAKKAFEEGRLLFDDEYFGDSVKPYELATQGFAEVKELLFELIRLERIKIESVAESNDFEGARQAARRLEWWADEDSASRLRLLDATARDLSRVEKIYRFLASGSFGDAFTLRSKIETRSYEEDMMKIDKLIEKHQRDSKVSSLVSSGYESLDAKLPDQARGFFSEALKMDAKNISAKEGLQEAIKIKTSKEIAEVKSLLVRDLSAENYVGALEAINRLEKIDSTFKKGAQADFLNQLISTEEKIDTFTEQMDYLNAGSFRRSLEDFIETLESRNAEQFGKRIGLKIQKLMERYQNLTTKIEWLIKSDNEANVLIKPGGALGKFNQIRVKLIPGVYELLARCTGRKEVVKKIEVTSKIIPPRSEIVCVKG